MANIFYSDQTSPLAGLFKDAGDIMARRKLQQQKEEAERFQNFQNQLELYIKSGDIEGAQAFVQAQAAKDPGFFERQLGGVPQVNLTPAQDLINTRSRKGKEALKDPEFGGVYAAHAAVGDNDLGKLTEQMLYAEGLGGRAGMQEALDRDSGELMSGVQVDEQGRRRDEDKAEGQRKDREFKDKSGRDERKLGSEINVHQSIIEKNRAETEKKGAGTEKIKKETEQVGKPKPGASTKAGKSPVEKLFDRHNETLEKLYAERAKAQRAPKSRSQKGAGEIQNEIERQEKIVADLQKKMEQLGVGPAKPMPPRMEILPDGRVIVRKQR